MENSKFMDKFINFATKIGNQIHLKALRDSFAILSPLFILAGLAVLINSVFFPWLLSGDALENAQQFGSYINNGSLNIASLLLAPTLAYFLSTSRDYSNPISISISVLAIYIVMLPSSTVVEIEGVEHVVEGVLSFQNLGTESMFAGIVVGLVATEILVKLSTIKSLRINLGEEVPPAVGVAFSLLIPIGITMSLFAAIAVILNVFFDTNLVDLIVTFIQAPLRGIVGNNLLGYLFLYSLGNFLFSLGIHQSVINGPFTDPFLLQNMNQNMLDFTNGDDIQYILTGSWKDSFPQMGGTGATISLLLAIFLFSKSSHYRQIAKLALPSGLFNINEPIIFGLPIVFNIPMIIPFVGVPVVFAVISYYATSWGLIGPTVVNIPWITPPVISGYLATAGDWRAPILQILLIILGAFIYLPFLRISERVQEQQAEAEN